MEAQLQLQIKLNSSASTARLECRTSTGARHWAPECVSCQRLREGGDERKREAPNCVAIVSPIIKLYNQSISNQSRHNYERDELQFFIRYTVAGSSIVWTRQWQFSTHGPRQQSKNTVTTATVPVYACVCVCVCVCVCMYACLHARV